MKEEIEIYLDDILESLFAAKRYNALWWELCGDKRPQHVEIMNRYGNFFRGLIGSTFDAGIVDLCKVIEDRKDTKNIYQLLDLIKQSNKFTVENIMSYETRLSAHNSTIKGIKTVRGNAVGHSNKSMSYFDAFKKASIQFNQWKALIDEIIKIVCEIYYQHSHIICEGLFYIKAVEELDGLLGDLKSFHKETS